MTLNINSNILSLNAQYNLNKTTNSLAGTMTRLSTGLKINTASDNAAGLAIAQGFTADINISTQGQSNAQDGINLLNVADGALSSMTDMAQRLLVLAQQASNGTVSSSQRGNIGAEFGKVLTSLGAIADTTSFNGTKLLDGTASNITIQLGATATDKETISLGSAQLAALSISGLSISNATSVGAAVSMVVKLKAAVDALSAARANVGAQQSVLNSDITSIGLKINALAQSKSSIMDIDVAQETANLTLYQIKQQAAVSVLSQANSQPQIALKLLQG